ncbi:malonyl-CoA decarboxylase [Limoniibacter endophyticus]|uniref:Decarboxylase n=1 Tax=Limoniibacter endophyticus TaxID=1565040 RepID=A0A8J3DRN8_9HYPH|nr:malonyl-CoA decarboxylase [Limoniibacter endophyticus]GHC77514.1 decarboxylase [Limoniibacter endophyticus]
MKTSFFSDLLATLFDRPLWLEATPSAQPMHELCKELLAGSGEITGMRTARTILSRYKSMTKEEKITFFQYLTEELDVDASAIIAAARQYGASPDARGFAKLSEASEPPRQEFLRRLNRVPGATGELVRMRLDLLGLCDKYPEFARADIDFVHLFKSWFNRGFLVLRHIDWHTPANILEKIIEYEAVHAINSWDELRRRLLPVDRRCFAFFHPAMVDEPLIFVEVALLRDIPGSIQAVLAEERHHIQPAQADTAVFYSISNCQAGLKGISFGNSLIKQVVEELSQEMPNLKNFVTLSPIPGLSRWLEKRAENHDEIAKKVLVASENGDGDVAALRDDLRALASVYLLEEKRSDGLPIDPVARFHLGNGASVHEVHALADKSANGLKQSCGAMVNYLYDLKTVEQNHENFVTQNIVASSRSVKAAAKSASMKRGTVANV